jgi:hypothetical protein
MMVSTKLLEGLKKGSNPVAHFEGTKVTVEFFQPLYYPNGALKGLATVTVVGRKSFGGVEFDMPLAIRIEHAPEDEHPFLRDMAAHLLDVLVEAAS